MLPEQHQAVAAIKKAAKLKGLHLHKMPGGYYALYRKVGRHTVEPISAWMHFVDVMRYFGASDRITLREALARDGIVWGN